MAKELASARWVHDTASFIRRRVGAILAENARLPPDKRLTQETAIERALREASTAFVMLPGNYQRPWDGRHASVAQGCNDGERKVIAAAVAKRERRCARRLALAAR